MVTALQIVDKHIAQVLKKVAYESSGSYGLKCSLYNVLMHINNIHLVDTS